MIRVPTYMRTLGQLEGAGNDIERFEDGRQQNQKEESTNDQCTLLCLGHVALQRLLLMDESNVLQVLRLALVPL